MIAPGSKLFDITLIKCLLVWLSSFGSSVLLNAQLLVQYKCKFLNFIFFFNTFKLVKWLFLWQMFVFEAIEMKYLSWMKSQYFYKGIGLSLISANRDIL